MNKYVLMLDKGMGYGDCVCLLSSIQGLHEREECRVSVLTNHPECFHNQPGVDHLADTSNFGGFWELECKDATQVFRYFYWEINGRMRGLPAPLLNLFRTMTGLQPTTKFPTFHIREQDFAIADELTKKARKPLVLFHRGLGRESKLLPMELCVRVVERLKKDYTVAQIGYTHDPEIPGTMQLRGKLSFLQSAAVMSRAHFMFGHDSLPAHMSGIVETPGIFMYGPTDPEDFGYKHNVNIEHRECPQSDYHCGRPCPWHFDYELKNGKFEDWECPDRRCMTGITMEEIDAAVVETERRIKEGIVYELEVN